VQPLWWRKSNKYYICWVCVCSLSHPACNASAHRLWSVRLYYIFLHYLINGTIFEKKKFIEHTMCVLMFSTTFVRNIPHYKKKGVTYDQKCILFMWCIRYCCQILMNIKFFSTDLRKVLEYQISWKSVQGEPSCSTQTDGQTWQN